MQVISEGSKQLPARSMSSNKLEKAVMPIHPPREDANGLLFGPGLLHLSTLLLAGRARFPSICVCHAMMPGSVWILLVV